MTKRITHNQKLITARHMYYSGIAVSDISEELDIEINTLGTHIFGVDRSGYDENCWYFLRQSAPEDSYISYVKSKGYLISIAEASLMKKTTQSAIAIAQDPETLTLSDTKVAVEILEKLDKMGRLERGEATEHVQVEQSFTLRDIINGVKLDPKDSIDAEFKPLSKD